MRSKVKYPDDYIRERQSIIAAAEMTYVAYEDGEFVVVAGDDEFALNSLEEALNLSAGHILGDGPVDSVEFIQYDIDEWRPNLVTLRRELAEAGRRRK